MKICVCDIGGTNFRIGVYCAGKLSQIKRKSTPNYLKFNEKDIKILLLNEIVRDFRELQKKNLLLNSLAICFPGPVDMTGEIAGSSVIFGEILSEKFNLKKDLEKQLIGINILVTNDMTASVFRYSNNYNDFCLITVSSGIGNKIYSRGRVLIDSKGITGEIGHYQVESQDLSLECTCGYGKNHVGMISSGRGIEMIGRIFAKKTSLYRELYVKSKLGKNTNFIEERITSEQIALCATNGDPFSRFIIDYCSKPLADIICLLATAMDISRFIIIGGFAINCEYYLESLVKNAQKKGVYNFSNEDIKKMVIIGEKDDNHGLIGIGKLFTKVFFEGYKI